MIKIKTSQDLKELKEASLISPAYYQAVEEQFWQLVEALSPPNTKAEDYSLEEDGYLVILQENDDPQHLEAVGLPCGLVNSWPEYIDVLELEDGSKVYRIAIMYDNDYMMFFYFDSQLYHDNAEFQAFLAEQLEWEDINNNEGRENIGS